MSSISSLKKPALFLNADYVAAICCNEIIPKLMESAEPLITLNDNEREIEDISKAEIERIRKSLISNDMNSYRLYSINLQSFKAMMNFDSLFSSRTILCLFDALKKRISMNWYNIVEAAKHENIEIANTLESILESQIQKQQRIFLSMSGDTKISDVAGIHRFVDLFFCGNAVPRTFSNRMR